MRVTAFTDALQIAVVWNANAAFALDRFDDHRGDRIVQGLLQRIEVVEGNVADAFQHRRKWLPVFRIGGGSERPESPAVVGAMGGNDAGPPCRDPGVFQGRLDRFGARVSE